MSKRKVMPTDSSDTSNTLTIVEIPIDRLLLDAENPRLAHLGKLRDQMEILKALWTQMSVNELVLSIAENGFFREEPLFVIPEDPKDSSDSRKYIVVEGNRRLAAVRILTDDSCRELVSATDMPRVKAADKEKLQSLPVSIYQKRRTLWKYLAFRHINNPMEWDAYAKAKYIVHVYEDYGVSLDEITRRTGDSHKTVVRLYQGYKVLEQAERFLLFRVDDRFRSRSRFYFSHLYTVLEYDKVLEFLGIKDSSRLVKDNPVPKSHHDELQELMLYLFGSKERNVEPIVVRQNPDLGRLRDVLQHKAAHAALRQGYSLEQAYRIVSGDKVRLIDSLTSAKVELQQALGAVATGYRGERELFNMIESIQQVVEAIRNQMEVRLSSKSRIRN